MKHGEVESITIEPCLKCCERAERISQLEAVIKAIRQLLGMMMTQIDRMEGKL